MRKNFILLQLHGDPAGDPQQKEAQYPAGDSALPDQRGGDTTPNDADLLYQWKRDHVSREEYQKEKDRADSYLKAILENREDEIAKKEGRESLADPNELCKELFVEDNNMSDLEYITKALNLRDARIANGEKDPFLPTNPEDRDYEIAEKVAEGLKECVRLANGDNASFIREVQNIMRDTGPIRLPKNNFRR